MSEPEANKKQDTSKKPKVKDSKNSQANNETEFKLKTAKVCKEVFCLLLNVLHFFYFEGHQGLWSVSNENKRKCF